MWVFTNKGFISVVQHREEKNVFIIRARAKKHLSDLFSKLKIETLPYADYRYRVYITKNKFKEFMDSYLDNLKYDNFKNSIEDSDYHDLCLGVWSKALDYQNSNK